MKDAMMTLAARHIQTSPRVCKIIWCSGFTDDLPCAVEVSSC